MGRKRVGWWLLSVASLLLLVGCAKRVPIEGLDFSPEEKVVLTFHDSSALTGRVDHDELVLYETSDTKFRGRIESVDEAEIVVADVVTLPDRGSHRYERERMKHYRLYVDDEDSDRLVLSRDNILQVQRIQTDKPRTFRRIIFWTFGAAIGLLAIRDRNF